MSFQHLTQITENPSVVLHTPDGDSWTREAYAEGYSLTSSQTGETLTINRLLKKTFPNIHSNKRRYLSPAQFLLHGFGPSIRNRVLARLIHLSNSYEYSDPLAQLTLPFYEHLINYPSPYPTPVTQSFTCFKWAAGAPTPHTAASLMAQHRNLTTLDAAPPKEVAFVSLTRTPDGCTLTTVHNHTLQDRWEAADNELARFFADPPFPQTDPRFPSAAKAAAYRAFFWYQNTLASVPHPAITTLGALVMKRYAEYLAAQRLNRVLPPPDPFPGFPLMAPTSLTFTLADLVPAPLTEYNDSLALNSFLAATAHLDPRSLHTTASSGIRPDRLKKWESQGFVRILGKDLTHKGRGPKPTLFGIVDRTAVSSSKLTGDPLRGSPGYGEYMEAKKEKERREEREQEARLAAEISAW